MAKTPREITVSEDFVDLTGDFVKAVILKFMIQESIRRDDFDQFLDEEVRRFRDKSDEMKFGWIAKPARELSEETLLRLTPPPMRSHLTKLVEMGYLLRKKDENPFEKTMHYRVNLINVVSGLFKLGYRFRELDEVRDTFFVDMIGHANNEPNARTSQTAHRANVTTLRRENENQRRKENNTLEYETDEIAKSREKPNNDHLRSAEKVMVTAQLPLWDGTS